MHVCVYLYVWVGGERETEGQRDMARSYRLYIVEGLGFGFQGARGVPLSTRHMTWILSHTRSVTISEGQAWAFHRSTSKQARHPWRPSAFADPSRMANMGKGEAVRSDKF